MSTQKLELPKMTHTFSINAKGKESQVHYIGDFTYVRPNLFKKIEISKMETRLSGDLKNLPDETKIVNGMIAQLFYCLTTYPDWWKDSNFGQNLYDLEILEAIWMECNNFEQEFHKKVYGDKSDKELKVEEIK